MKSILVRLGLTALVIGGLAGCGGASIGVNGVNTGGTGIAGGTNATAAINGQTLSAAQWQALAPQISASDISVSISTASGVAGTPVVKFKVTDGNGNPVVGLGGQYPAVGTAVTHSNYNLNFTLAKLVPGTNGNPSKWVNLLVDKPVASGTAGAVVNSGLSWLAAYPTAEAQGTLVDNGDGTYQYTFLRDIKQTQAIVNGDTTANNKADLDPTNLAFDPTATHRLGIIILGSQPGTGINTPTATAQLTPVPLLKTFNIGYDFRPDGNPVTNTRDIVDAGSCDACHDNVKLKRGLGHISLTGTSSLAVSYNASGVATTVTMSNGIPAGTYVGRNDPKLCVTCHTDQTKYGFAVVTGDGTFNYGYSAYYRVATGVLGDNQAAFTYPRMIHQTHMGNQLVKQGYNLNGHDANCASATVGKDVGAAQCFNGVGYPQDQRNCTKCHTGTTGNGTAVVTKDGDNWKNIPSQLACGACHDGINFAGTNTSGPGTPNPTGSTLANKYADLAAGNAAGTTQSGHQGGVQADNSKCTTCHTPGGISDVAVYHETNFSTPNNPVASAGVSTIAYTINKVTVNAAGNLVMNFGITLNGSPVTSLPVLSTANTPSPGLVTVTSSGAVATNAFFQILPGLESGPSFYVAYAVPQDGVTPYDYNYSASVSLPNLLIDTTKGVTPTSPSKGWLSNPVSGTGAAAVFQADSSNSFTATITGDTLGQAAATKVTAAPIVIPGNASIVTGAMIGGFTQVNLPAYPWTDGSTVTGAKAVGKGLHITAVLQKLTASTCSQPGNTAACKTARRVIVSTAKCQNCHEQLGTNQFMDNGILPTLAGAADATHRLGFHNGDRNDPTACNICHNPNRPDNDGMAAGTNTGFPANSSTFYHGLHGGSQRTVPYIIESGYLDFSKLLFPGQLKDCSQCHLDNTANFGIAEATGQLPNLLWSATSAGTVPAVTSVENVMTGVVASAVSTTYPVGTLTAAPTVAVGNLFSYTIPASGVGAYATYTSDTVLLNSPFAAACSSCHDDATSQRHMKVDGGAQLQVTHAVAAGGATQPAASGVPGGDVPLVNTEFCVTCHGQGRAQDAILIHQLR